MEAILEKKLEFDKSEWKLVKFVDVVKEPKESIKDPVTAGVECVVGLEHIETEDLHLRSFNTIEESTTFTKAFKKGDVLFGRRRAYLKKAAMAEFDGICSGDITVFRAKENLLPELLPFIVNNDKFFDWAVKHSAGGLSPRVKFKDLAKYEFLLPPKDQQTQLADLLWAMDEMMESEKEALHTLEVLKLSFVKHSIYEQAIENGVKFVTLGEIFNIKTGNKNAQDAVSDGEYPFFTRSIETQRIDSFEYDQEALILPGEGNFQIKYYKGKFNVHQRTYILSDNNHFKINLPLYRDIVEAKVVNLIQTSVGSTVNSLRKPIIQKIKVPLLTAENQEKILEKVRIQDISKLKLEKKILSSRNLLKGLINQLF